MAAGLIFSGAAQANPVLLISIDGLRPGDVLEAQARGLAIPQLRRLVEQGAHASGVVGVLPSLTLPSHVTLLTGVAPARHGVYNNLAFLPENAGGAPGLDLADAIKVPTLWDAAHAVDLRTASINWPVSQGARGVDFNVSVAFRIDEAEEERIAARLLTDQKPGFATIHFGALDEAEHKYGPGSPEAKTALETLDGYIGQLVATARAAQPDTVVAVVSDHGFTAVTREVNLPRAFIDAGLIKIDAAGRLASWEAVPWAAGGSAAIVLARPDDKALVARVAALLDKLKADPALGIEEVYDAAELARRGGFPGASFGLSYRLDTTGPAARPLSQALVGPAVQKGTHGHALSHPELRSTFIIAGPGIPAGRDLGVIDMRAIAPTLAGVLGTSLPQAEGQSLAPAWRAPGQ